MLFRNLLRIQEAPLGPLGTVNLLYAWGLNDEGQLGLNDLITRSSPVQVGSLSWTSVSAGRNHTMAIRSDNTLWAWGSNSEGQLGQNNLTTRSSPVQVGTSSWTSVSAGGTHTMAINLVDS